MSSDDDYKRGYREGYQDGMDSARKMLDPFLPIVPGFPPFNVTPNVVCRVCSRDLSSLSNYVCAISSCPSNVRAVTE
jgi:hypothetical protein